MNGPHYGGKSVMRMPGLRISRENRRLHKRDNEKPARADLRGDPPLRPKCMLRLDAGSFFMYHCFIDTALIAGLSQAVLIAEFVLWYSVSSHADMI